MKSLGRRTREQKRQKQESKEKQRPTPGSLNQNIKSSRRKDRYSRGKAIKHNITAENFLAFKGKSFQTEK